LFAYRTRYPWRLRPKYGVFNRGVHAGEYCAASARLTNALRILPQNVLSICSVTPPTNNAHQFVGSSRFKERTRSWCQNITKYTIYTYPIMGLILNFGVSDQVTWQDSKSASRQRRSYPETGLAFSPAICSDARYSSLAIAIVRIRIFRRLGRYLLVADSLLLAEVLCYLRSKFLQQGFDLIGLNT
jgi:hypothetical protein